MAATLNEIINQPLLPLLVNVQEVTEEENTSSERLCFIHPLFLNTTECDPGPL